jgi:CO/xanthine dehydrogenase Mo-binding subunit
MSTPPPALPPLPATLAANPVLSAWLDFTRPGVVTIGTGKVEYGQGVWTALAQVAAEELDVDLRRVRVAPVSTATSPDEGVTSGSRSIEESGSALRQACAQARHLFLAAAADRLDAVANALGVTDGEITTDAGGTGLTYWSLAGPAGPAVPGLLDREAGDPEPAKAPARWSVAGRSAARLDIPDKVTGRPRFLHDLVLPGMLYGRVIRPPAPAASLAGPGDPPLPGDVEIVRDGSFLGVVAPSDRAAVTSARAVAGTARWEVTPSLPDEHDLKEFLLSGPAQVVTVDEVRDEEAAAAVTRTLEAEFTRPYLAHASMAPSCAVARWDGPRVTVWSHSQGVFALRGAIAAGLGLADGQVTVRLRPQRCRRRRAGRGAAGPRGARAPGPGAVVAGGRDGLGAGRLGHAGPAVGRPRCRWADQDLAPGRVEQRLHRPPRQRR